MASCPLSRPGSPHPLLFVYSRRDDTDTDFVVSQGFFGMNFFSVDGNGWKWLPNFWMFFAFTAPITFAGLVLFMFEVNVVGWSRRNFSKPVKNWYLDKQRKRSRSRNQRRRNTQTETTHAGTNSQTQTNVNMDTNTIGQNDGVV